MADKAFTDTKFCRYVLSLHVEALPIGATDSPSLLSNCQSVSPNVSFSSRIPAFGVEVAQNGLASISGRGESSKTWRRPTRPVRLHQYHCAGHTSFGINPIHAHQSCNLIGTIMAAIPQLQYTPTNAIPAIAKEVRLSFASQKTKPLEWRLVQLRKLYWR